MMSEDSKERFRILLSEHFDNNLSSLNECLTKQIDSINKKKDSNNKSYYENKDNDEFKEEKKNYDKKYYDENKEQLLITRKSKYNTDSEYREKVKETQKATYLQSKQLIKT